VPGSALDVVLVLVALLFAVSGYRQGFVVGALSFIGFLGGGVIGATAAPAIADSGPFVDLPRPVVGLGVVFLAASLGQLLATLLGATVRDRLTWSPARALDAAGGAVVSVASLLLVAWLIGSAVASSSFQTLASEVRRSAVLQAVDDVMPTTAQRFFASFRRLIDDRGFPEVFGGLAPTQVTDVEPPDPALAGSPVVAATQPSILKVTGVAEACRRRIEGTGFVYAPQRLMTNAHVVAGVTAPRVEVGDRELEARVVLFDPGRDIAVLAVPDLDRPALPFAGPAEPGAGAIIAGYPQNGPFRADSARIRDTQRARGPDIYQEQTVVREIYALRGLVRPGNSGGPLLTPEGQVYGVIFAAAADDQQVGYALTAAEVAGPAQDGAAATQPVDTRSCD
jgi:S1-C subfamily serine protease